MMDELISRQAAIDGKICIQRSNGVEIYDDYAVPVEYLERLPPAQLSTNLAEVGTDCISRRQAIKATWQDTGYTDPFNVMTAIRDRIQQLPPIQPKRGRWIRTGSGSLYDHYECSECGKAPKWDCMGDNRWRIAFTEFCPNCGAKMEGEHDG